MRGDARSVVEWSTIEKQDRLVVQQDRYRQWLGMSLLPLGALVVHEVRYALAFGPDAANELAGRGHGYLHALTPLIMLAVVVGLGSLLGRLARARRCGDRTEQRERRLASLWALACAGLLAIHAGQELLEGLLATGHPHGLGGVLDDGAPWALAASIVVGGLLAVLVRGGSALVARAARLGRGRPRRARRGTPAARARRHVVVLGRPAPMAGASAGRAPPV